MGQNGIMGFLPATALLAVDQLPDPAFARDMPAARIDGAAIAAVTDLYRELLPAGGAILDVMSGWISHLPPEAPYHRVVGVGVDRKALAENPFLDEWRAQDLNRDAVRRDPVSRASRRGDPRGRAGVEAGRAADRHLLEPMSGNQSHRLLVPAR